MTRHEAMFNWIGTYPKIADMFTFDFGEAIAHSNQFKVLDEQVKRKDVVGNEYVTYKFSIGEYRKVTQDPFTTENIENLEAVDEFIEWVNQQNKVRNYPQIPNAVVEEVRADRTGIASFNPYMRLAQYTFVVTVSYIQKEM